MFLKIVYSTLQGQNSRTKMQIFLIGFMGCGKSAIGKQLADKLGFDFIDLDPLIEKENQLPISEIFQIEGEDKFRELEHNCLKDVSTTLNMNNKNTIISTGGGTPCFYDNMELMNKSGITIYLQMSAKYLLKRLRNEKNTRPLIKGLRDEKLKDYIQENLKQREPHYLQARHTVNAENPEDVLKDCVFIIAHCK